MTDKQESAYRKLAKAAREVLTHEGDPKAYYADCWDNLREALKAVEETDK